MYHNRRILSGVLLIVLLAVLAVNPAFADLIKNRNYSRPDSAPTNVITDWSLTPVGDWLRKTRLINPGAPYATAFLERRCDGGAAVDQTGIAVETNTWFLLTAWYRARLTPAPNSGNVWLGMTLPRDSNNYIYTDQRITLGSSPDWRQARVFVFSGTNSLIGVQARFFGTGDCAVGEFELRRVEPADFKGRADLDGDFEVGAPGNVPADFSGGSCMPFLSEDGNPVSGKMAMRLDLPMTTNVSFSLGQKIPALPGSILRVSLRARSSVAGCLMGIIFSRQQTSATNAPFWAERKDVVLTSSWEEYQLEAVVPSERGRGYTPGPQLLAFVIAARCDKPATLWFDSLKVDYQPPEAKKAAPETQAHNLLMNSSFEAGTTGWDWRFPHFLTDDVPDYPWGSAAIDRKEAFEGSCSMRMEVPQPGIPGLKSNYDRTDFMSAFIPITENRKYMVSFWMKTQTPGPVQVYLTPCYFLHGASVTIQASPEWRRYSLEITPRQTDPNYPCGDYMVLLFRFTKGGVYWLDAIQVEEGPLTDYTNASALEVGAVMSRVYPGYRLGEQPKTTLFLHSRLKETVRCRLRWTVRDYRQQIQEQAERSVALAGGQSRVEQVPLFAKRTGVFVAEFELSDPATRVEAHSPVIYGIFPEPRVLSSPEESSFGNHINDGLPDGLIYLRNGTLDDLMRFAQLTGIHWSREFAFGSWALHEPEQGRWRWMDRYVEAAGRHGIKLLPILGSTVSENGARLPKWSNSDEPTALMAGRSPGFYPRMELWTNYVAEVVRHYQGKVNAFEVMNETGGFGPQKYVEYSRAARETARTVNPAARIVAPGYPCQGVPYGPKDNSWIGEVLKGGLYTNADVFSVHFYGPAPYCMKALEDDVDEYGTLEQSLALRMNYLRTAYGTNPVWDTEWGVGGREQVDWLNDPKQDANPVYRNATPRIQAERTVRWVVMKKAAGVGRFFWHTLLRGSVNVGGGRGLVGPDDSPMPAAVAYAQLAKRLERSTFVKKINLGKATWVYGFEVDGKPLCIYWNYETPEGGRLRLPVETSAVQVEDIMGNTITPKPAGSWWHRLRGVHPGIVLPLDTSPVYVISQRMNLDELLAGFAKAQALGVTPARVAVTLGHREGKPAVVVGLNNLGNEPVKTTVNVGLPEGWQAEQKRVIFSSVASGETAVRYDALRNVPGILPEVMLSVKGTLGDKPLTAQRALRVYQAPRCTTPITLDGELTEAEYGSAPLLELNTAAQLRGKDHAGWTPSNGCAQVRIVWDEQALFIAANVTDDRVQNSVPLTELFNGDCLEIYFDTATDENMFENSLHENQGKFLLAPAQPPEVPAPRVYCRSVPSGGTIRRLAGTQSQVASKRTPAGWTLECRLPVSDLKLSAGVIWGFDVSLIDCDGVPPHQAHHQYYWAGRGDDPWNRPHGFGFLWLK